MSSRSASRATNSRAPYDDELTKDDPSYLVYRIGVYGWRKRCLYFLIFLIFILGLLNLALIMWVMRVQKFGLGSMGKMNFEENKVDVNGRANMMNLVRGKFIKTPSGLPMRLNSHQNITLSARDRENNVRGQIVLTRDQVIFKNKQLIIQDLNGKELLYADGDRFRLNLNKMDITVPGGLKFENSIQTTKVESGEYGDLALESLTKQLHVSGAMGVSFSAGNISMSSLKDANLVSKRGQVYLNAGRIRLSNLPVATFTKNSPVVRNARELCICGDGTLFLAPADQATPCKVDSAVCQTSSG